MRSRKRTISAIRQSALLLSILSLAGTAVSAQPMWFRFEDIREVLSADQRPNSTAAAVRIEQAPQTRFTADNAPASPDASLERPIARLRLDANWLLAVPESPPPLFEFQMGEYPFRMVLAEKHWDYDFDAMHFTLIDPVTDDYARITVGFTEQEMVGTVFIGGDEFRLLPVAEDTQFVFPVRDRARFRHAVPPDLDTRMGRLEARHLQMAWYAEYQPGKFDTRTDGRLHSFIGTAIDRPPAPRIGAVNYLAAIQTDADGTPVANRHLLAASIENLLNDIPHVTMIYDPIAVTIEREDILALADGRQDDSTIRFHQVDDGIPIDPGMIVVIDRSGQVRLLNGTLMRANMFDRPTGPTLSQAQAVQAAIDAATALHAINWPLEVTEARELHELPNDVFSTLRIWRVNLNSIGCDLQYRVDINATTGAIFMLQPNIRPPLGRAFSPRAAYDEFATACRQQAAPG